MSSKPVVLSDGPNGVEWGSGNLKGNMEGGYLVWRNRHGEATFFWNKVGCLSTVPHAELTTIAGTTNQAPPSKVPTKPHVEVKAENNSPRSTNSTRDPTPIDPVEMRATMESLIHASPLNENQ